MRRNRKQELRRARAFLEAQGTSSLIGGLLHSMGVFADPENPARQYKAEPESEPAYIAPTPFDRFCVYRMRYSRSKDSRLGVWLTEGEPHWFKSLEAANALADSATKAHGVPYRVFQLVPVV
jgi:hypothetical protein